MEDHYGRWTVLGEEERGSNVLCICQCGTLARVRRDDLARGKSKSCVHCQRRELRERLRNGHRAAPELAPTERWLVVIPGARFGRLVALSEPYSVLGKKNRMADVRCDCGVEKTVVASHLTGGRRISSCGCLRQDKARALHTATVPTPISTK